MSRFAARIAVAACLVSQAWAPAAVLAATSSAVQATIRISVCGNGAAEGGEDCDGSDLNGRTCQTLAFASGSLTCNPACGFDTSMCVAGSGSPPPSSGGGGGGGGGAGYTAGPVVTQVVFSGRAFPLSKVVVLKDGQIAVSTIAGPDARFEVSLTGLAAGNYGFAVYGEDSANRRSGLFSFPVYITDGVTTKVSGIFIAPTIGTDKSQVKRGDPIVMFGQSVPNGEVTIAIHSDEEIFRTVRADAAGAYLYRFDTAALAIGAHETKAKTTSEDEISPFGTAVAFTVGDQNVTAVTSLDTKGDLNGDNRVNLVDFSIMAYWYKRPLSGAFVQTEREHLNGDGAVDIVDFSIMAHYWSG